MMGQEGRRSLSSEWPLPPQFRQCGPEVSPAGRATFKSVRPMVPTARPDNKSASIPEGVPVRAIQPGGADLGGSRSLCWYRQKNNPIDRGRKASGIRPAGPQQLLQAGRSPPPAHRSRPPGWVSERTPSNFQVRGTSSTGPISSHCCPGGCLLVGPVSLHLRPVSPNQKIQPARADAPRVPTSSSFALTFDSLSGVMICEHRWRWGALALIQ